MPSKPTKRSSVPVVYWDSCVFIDFLKQTPGRIDTIRELVAMAQNGELLIITSVIVEGEVIKWPEDGISDDDANRKLADFFRDSWIIRRAADARIMGIVRRLRQTHKLKLPDAIHVATALVHNVVALHTYDKDDLLKRDGVIPVDGKTFLKIVKPEHPKPPPNQPLFASLPDGEQ